MNLDFTKPTEKMRKLAVEHKIDLNDPNVINEFKKIQSQNLKDIRKLKEGKFLNPDGERTIDDDDSSPEITEELLKQAKKSPEEQKKDAEI